MLLTLIHTHTHDHRYTHTHTNPVLSCSQSWITGLYNRVRQTDTFKEPQAILMELIMNLKKGTVSGRGKAKNYLVIRNKWPISPQLDVLLKYKLISPKMVIW